MHILTAQQMQKVDAETIAHVVPGLELMERAGRGVAKTILAQYADSPLAGEARPKVVIFVGSGNNGGDGLVVARLLVEAGWACSIHLLKPADQLSPDAAKNYQRLASVKASGYHELDASRPDWPERVREDVADATLVVDAIFGTGASGAPRGRAEEMIAAINEMRARGVPVVSIDIPSGVDSTTGDVPGAAVRASETLTIGAPKTGLLFYPGKAHVGALAVVDIGFPEEIVETHAGALMLLDESTAAERLPGRAPDIHKYEAGSLLVIAGSEAFRGAALLTAEAALRSGCGMVFLAVPEGIRREMIALREAIVVSLPQTAHGTAARASADVLAPYLERADAVAIGPGMGRDDETDAFVRSFVRASGKPVVVDADGITAFQGRAADLADAASPVVVTPHDGEVKRLTGRDVPREPLARTEFARAEARRLGVTLLLKGAPTLIAGPDGLVWVNASGSSALATGGTGDVLTGLIGGLLAQAVAPRRHVPQAQRVTPVQVTDATCVACFLHGEAGELAARGRGVRGVLAGDLLDSLGPVLVALEARAGD
jgi:NAD(P)H-hydrate epimerase